jgi:hypothetical protein
MSIFKKLTNDIVTADQERKQKSVRILSKWDETGLLEGLQDVHAKEGMAQLLENQASELLREASAIGDGLGGDSGTIRGFSNIAFPIVRRVFAGLLANQLVSIQPMALPSGLIFYLDYTYGNNEGFDTYTDGDSIYGRPTGAAVRAGAEADGGMYNLNGTAFSNVHEFNLFKVAFTGTVVTGTADTSLGQISFAVAADSDPFLESLAQAGTLRYAMLDLTSGSYGRRLQAGKDFTDVGTANCFIAAPAGVTGVPAGDTTGVVTALQTSVETFTPADSNTDTVGDLTKLNNLKPDVASGVTVYRRHNKFFAGTGAVSFTALLGKPTSAVEIEQHAGNYDTGDHVYSLVLFNKAADADPGVSVLGGVNVISASYVVRAGVLTDADGQTITTPQFESDFRANSANGLPTPEIPEIDIRIESVAVTATTRKLRARWSPELAQDLNAYHTLDAEVELTQVLSEQIALEIDREILNDLVENAAAANYFWSRIPGKFVNKLTGAELLRSDTLASGPAFTGTVREWYETLVETTIDVANEIHRKTLRGAGNFIVTSPQVSTILEASAYYKPNFDIDALGQVSNPMQVGAEPVGTVSNRFTVYKDPYFKANKILVGFKGNSFLETGYVYAPYVPLIVTPTLYDTEDFTPRKGVMTRYGKKMVRADFYGTVTCLDLNIF